MLVFHATTIHKKLRPSLDMGRTTWEMGRRMNTGLFLSGGSLWIRLAEALTQSISHILPAFPSARSFLMRLFVRLAITTVLSCPFAAQSAQLWSACQTIDGVSNYLGYGGSVVVSLSPGISGCNPVGIPGAVAFSVSQNGVTADNISSFLATALAAYSAGHQVMLYYDNSTANCQGGIIAAGGFAGQCP
jgi:hypothetical protein